MKHINPKYLIFLSLFPIILFQSCSSCWDEKGTQENQPRLEALKEKTPSIEQSSKKAEIRLKTSPLKKDNIFLAGDTIAFLFSAQCSDGISNLKWCISKLDKKSNKYREIKCIPRAVNTGSESEEFSDSSVLKEPGHYMIKMYMNYGKSPGPENPDLGATLSIRVVDQLTVISLSEKNQNEDNEFHMNQQISFKILAGDKDGIKEVLWHLEKKNIKTGKYNIVPGSRTRHKNPGARYITLEDLAEIPGPGNYRIAAYSYDRLYKDGKPGHRNPFVFLPLKIKGYRTEITLFEQEGFETSTYLFDTPIKFSIQADDIDGIQTVFWYIARMNELTGEFRYITDSFHRHPCTGNVSVKIEDMVSFLEPGTYRISAFVMDNLCQNNDPEHINPTESKTIDVIGFYTGISINDLLEKENSICMNTPFMCNIFAADKDGIDSIDWCIYKKDEAKGKFILVDDKCREYSFSGEKTVKFSEELSFSEPGTYKLKITASDDSEKKGEKKQQNPSIYHTIKILGYRTAVQINDFFQNNGVFLFDSPVDFDIIAEDINGIDTITWCLYRKNRSLGGFKLVENSCRTYRFRGEPRIYFNEDILLGDPGIYMISASSRDSIYNSKKANHENPRVYSSSFKISGYQTKISLENKKNKDQGFQGNSTVDFKISAKDKDGLNKILRCVYRMNEFKGRYEIIQDSCKRFNGNGGRSIEINDRYFFTEPGKYKIDATCWDADLSSSEKGNKNPSAFLEINIIE